MPATESGSSRSLGVDGRNLCKDVRDKLKEYQRKRFNLERKNYPADETTVDGKCMDLTFS